MHDGLMRFKLFKRAHIVGFVDDIALKIRGKHSDELVGICNTAIGCVTGAGARE